MSRGFTTIHFIGGTRDNTTIDEVPINRIPKNLRFRSEVYFATTKTNDMAVMKGELNNNWHSYSVDIYTRTPSNKYQKGTIFTFNETRMVERCFATTQKKRQCINPAKHEKTYCCEAHKLEESKEQ
jgi:hypothetical protein